MKFPSRALFLALLLLTSAFPWGPHSEITRAALSAIGGEAPLAKLLGPETPNLAKYCWYPDTWMQFSGDHYNDDFLLFPKRPVHLGTSHAFKTEDGAYGAHSRELFATYFHRALLALRCENPINAARWVGALAHFTEDTGAPPHAIKESSALHPPMEQWVDPKQVGIPGYEPAVLGEEDERAMGGFWKRQERLNQFAIGRAGRIKPLVAEKNRAEAEPLILECANESARAAADLFATLGALAAKGTRGATLRGQIKGNPVGGPLSNLLAKVMVEGTDLSTLADAQGRYELRNLPAGKLRLLIIQPGSEVWMGEATLPAGGAIRDIALAPSRIPGNLLRNPAFELHWANPQAPDLWCFRRGVWRTESLRVEAGAAYRMEVQWKKNAGAVTLRWSSFERLEEGRHTNEATLRYPETSLVAIAPSGMKFAHPVVEGAAPDEALGYLAFVPHAGPVPIRESRATPPSREEAAPSPRPAPGTQGERSPTPVLSFSFDEGSGSAVTEGRSGKSLSAGGRGWKEGRSGKALAFAKDPLDCGKDLGAFTGELTLCAWTLFHELPVETKQRADLLARQDGNKTGWCFGVEAGSLAFVYRGSGKWAYAGFPAKKGEWMHLAVTVSAEKTSFYINGELKGTGAGQTGLACDGNLKIGERFSGLLDEVRAWNRALTALELSALCGK